MSNFHEECPNCGMSIPEEGLDICPTCGENLQEICIHCGNIIGPNTLVSEIIEMFENEQIEEEQKSNSTQASGSSTSWKCPKCGTISIQPKAFIERYGGAFCKSCHFHENPAYDFNSYKTRPQCSETNTNQNHEFAPGIYEGKLPIQEKQETLKSTHIRIRRTVLDRMLAYTKHCDIEIEGLATSRFIESEGYYEIDRCLPLFEQACSGRFTEIATEDLAKWACNQQEAISKAKEANTVWFWRQNMTEQACKVMGISEDQLNMIMPRWTVKYPEEFKPPNIPQDIVAKTNVHWHSHVNMSTFWSGTDINNAKMLAKEFGCKYAILFVLNHKGNVLVKFESFDPPFTNANVELKVIEDRKWIIDIKSEVKDKIFRMSDGYKVDDKTDKIVKDKEADANWQRMLGFRNETHFQEETSATSSMVQDLFEAPEIMDANAFFITTGITLKQKFERYFNENSAF